MMAIAIAAVLTVVGCTDKTKFTITGQTDVSELGKVRIMLLNPENGLTEFITDTVINNKFRIQASVEQPVLAFLFLDGRSPLVDFMLENGAKYNITVAANKVNVESDSKEEILNKQLKVIEDPEQYQQIYADLRAAQVDDNAEKANELIARLQTLGKEIEEKQLELVRNNPQYLAPAYRLFVKKSQIEFGDVKREFEAMGDAARNSEVGQKVAQYIKRVEGVAIGATAPDFTAPTVDGQQLRFSDVKAKVKILDFWASWCTPCRMSSPELVKIYKDYKNKGLEIVSVSLDDNADEWKAAIQQDGLDWIHVSDLKGWKSEIAELYTVNGIPSVFIVDESNTIVGTSHSPEEMRQIIENIVGKK